MEGGDRCSETRGGEVELRHCNFGSRQNPTPGGVDNLVCVASPQSSLGVSLQLQNKFLERTCFGVVEKRAMTLVCGAHKVIIAQGDRRTTRRRTLA